MKICHVITRMIIGGAQENTLFSCLGQIKNGHDVTLITGEDNGLEGSLLDTNKHEGLNVVVMESLVRNLSPFDDYIAYRKLKTYFRKHIFDIVHTHASKAGILARIAASKAQMPGIIHTVHGPPFHRYESSFKNYLYIAAEKFAAKKCHRILCVANAMKQQYLAEKIGKEDMYEVVFSGMDIDSFLTPSTNKNLREKYHIAEDAIIVGKIARLFELKGHEFLIKAAEKVIAANKNVIFLLIGDGLKKDPLTAQIDNAGLTEYFRFTGLLAPSEIPDHVKMMDIVAHLSLREGLPRVIIQGMAAGKPVVGYDLDGTPEVLTNGHNGFLCPAESVDEVAEGLIKLAESEELRNNMGKKGQEIAKAEFPWKVMVDRLDKNYERLLINKRTFY